jgi:putative nucleotidyltransferase with HDIG domain
MSLTPSIEEQSLLAGTLELESTQMTREERTVELAVSLALFVAVAVLWHVVPPHGINVGLTAACVALMALATFVRFDTPFGFTVATQLAFVPLVFAVPLATVPLAVVAALAISRLWEVLAGKIRPGRLLLVVGNSWFALGPVAVFALAGTQPREAGALLLAAALGGQFVVDFAISGVRHWVARDASLKAQLRETWVYAIDAALSGVALVIAEDVHRAPTALLAVIPLLGLIATFAHERRDRLQSLLELGSAYRGTALVLGDVIEADDGYTGEHCKGVVGLALAIGEQLGLEAEQLRNLEFGALLHDVGKIAIPKEIINKPGRLDPHEWTIIKTHTIEGQKMLDRVGGFMREVGLIVRSHHERWDGTGYPDRLRGQEIPLEARIIACCDTWHAMRTDRSYRAALPRPLALRELQASAGSQLDPRVVDALLRIVAEASRASAGIAQTDQERRQPAAVIAASLAL